MSKEEARAARLEAEAKHFTCLPEETTSDIEALYRKRLEEFDFQFEFSDDHAVWARGHNDLARLRRMQRDIDPDGYIWMSYPGAHTHGAPQPIVREGGAA